MCARHDGGELTFERVRAALAGFSGACIDACGGGAFCRCDGGGAFCRCDGGGGGGDGRVDSSTASRRAAVMVVIVGEESPNVIMTTKPAHLRMHAGEVSFPGGKTEDGDGDLLDTALRETREEIGLVLGRRHAEARLCDVVTRNSGFVITPFVAVLDGVGTISSSSGRGIDAERRPACANQDAAAGRGNGPGGAKSTRLVLAPNTEVAEILVLPLGPLLGTMSPDVDPAHSPVRGMYAFEYGDPGGVTVWGASARILAQVHDLIGAGQQAF